MLSRRTLKVFLLSWFSFAFFFVSIIAPLNADLGRPFSAWLIRGTIAGFFVGAITAYLDHRKRASNMVRQQGEELRQ